MPIPDVDDTRTTADLDATNYVGLLNAVDQSTPSKLPPDFAELSVPKPRASDVNSLDSTARVDIQLFPSPDAPSTEPEVGEGLSGVTPDVETSPGQLLKVDIGEFSVHSLLERVHMAVEKEMKVEGIGVELVDAQGRKVQTDADLGRVIGSRRRMPLRAVPSASSIEHVDTCMKELQTLRANAFLRDRLGKLEQKVETLTAEVLTEQSLRERLATRLDRLDALVGAVAAKAVALPGDGRSEPQRAANPERNVRGDAGTSGLLQEFHAQFASLAEEVQRLGEEEPGDGVVAGPVAPVASAAPPAVVGTADGSMPLTGRRAQALRHSRSASPVPGGGSSEVGPSPAAAAAPGGSTFVWPEADRGAIRRVADPERRRSPTAAEGHFRVGHAEVPEKALMRSKRHRLAASMPSLVVGVQREGNSHGSGSPNSHSLATPPPVVAPRRPPEGGQRGPKAGRPGTPPHQAGWGAGPHGAPSPGSAGTGGSQWQAQSPWQAAPVMAVPCGGLGPARLAPGAGGSHCLQPQPPSPAAVVKVVSGGVLGPARLPSGAAPPGGYPPPPPHHVSSVIVGDAPLQPRLFSPMGVPGQPGGQGPPRSLSCPIAPRCR